MKKGDGERLLVLSMAEGGLVGGRCGRCSTCGGWEWSRGEDCWCFAWERGVNTCSLYGDSSSTGMGGALHGRKTGALRGRVGGRGKD